MRKRIVGVVVAGVMAVPFVGSAAQAQPTLYERVKCSVTALQDGSGVFWCWHPRP